MITRSVSKLASNDDGALEDAEEETEVPVFKKADLDITFQAHYKAEDPPNVPGDIGKYRDLGIPVTNSGYMNTLVQPYPWQLDPKYGREKTLDYYWAEYREEFVGEEHTDKEIRMLNTGEIEGVKDKKTRDQVKDPVQRAAIASKVYLKDRAITTNKFYNISFNKIDEEFAKKFPMPTYEHEPETPEERERMKQRLETRAMMEAIRQENKVMIENQGTYFEHVMGTPAVSTAEYQSNKIMELQNVTNLLLKKIGTIEEELEEVKTNAV